MTKTTFLYPGPKPKSNFNISIRAATSFSYFFFFQIKFFVRLKINPDFQKYSKIFLCVSKFGFRGPFRTEKIQHTILSLACRLCIGYGSNCKVSANFGFGIGPKLKQRFRLYTRQVDAICFVKYVQENDDSWYANSAFSKQ